MDKLGLLDDIVVVATLAGECLHGSAWRLSSVGRSVWRNLCFAATEHSCSRML